MWRKRFNRRTHPVWFITCYAAGTIGGIAVSGLLDSEFFIGVQTPLISVFLLGVTFINRRLSILLIALLAGFLLGGWRGGLEQQALKSYVPYYGQSVVIRGVINQDISYGPEGDQRLRLRAVQIDQQKLPGIMWVSTPTKAEIKRGDEVILSGQLVKGFGNFPATLRRVSVDSVVRPTPGDVPRRIRDWFTDGIKRAVPEPEASLSVGYLAGQQSALPEVLSQQLRIVGLTHVVVASGYNLTILVGFARRLFAKYSKYLAALSASTMIIGFVLVTGFSPSMSRAGLVSMLSLIAWYYGRTVHPVVLLTLVATATAVWRPSYVWGDVGWYLSFAAFTGVIILSPLLQCYFWGEHKKIGMLRQTLIDTTAAQLLTLPIILYSFGQYATYALFANMLVLPLVPIAMLLTFIAGIAGLAVPGFAHIIGLPAKFILWCNILAITWISRFPGASGEIKFSLKALGISYAFLLIVMMYLWHSTKYNFRQQNDQKLTVF